MLHLLLEAAKIATNSGDRGRCFLLGAIGVRQDQAIVRAHNGMVYIPQPSAHAERRCLKKAGYGCTIYVARIVKLNGSLGLARPCNNCWLAMQRQGVVRCYYTISNTEYGVITFGQNKDSYTERVRQTISMSA